MYSIDINFLKDRQSEEANKTFTQTRSAAPTAQEQIPMLIGLGVMVLLIAFPLGLLALLNWQTTQTQKNVEELKVKVKEFTDQNQKLTQIRKYIQAIDENTQSLVSVFNQVKPASAILQEIRNRIPEAVQVSSIKQTLVPQTAPPGQPAPPGQSSMMANQLTLEGYAINYDDVNKFILSLQNSPFFKAETIKLIKAESSPLPLELENPEKFVAKNLIVEFPEGVKYTIVTQLNESPASQLLPALARNGAVGLVTRIKTLEQKGVLKP
ncbi:PilN domain-containing protein [Gloeothece verrucosa]|uniref:Fimbrial assembly family protein n=1 Tax=Gloeothece verrucosa (strain PCC 7822) TaxID=497965 RepID=E0UHF0_GLOV7|nr:PilN domain-containing protein [Gloeothece verrucosa]ADN12091.1 Fimbrial assembly family protein [Gloeothece verrucosa PCC 7822]